MFSKELLGLLFQVVTSWQVIAATIAVVLYLWLVLYVARPRIANRIPRSMRKFSPPKEKKEKTKPVPEEEITDEDDELGLEE